ncbi:MAG: 3-deoxy-D-manno-octulosonic acid transferase [Thermodesulfovibrio sp.]|nr:3-deoxy-D-manno-octulosonic acid transferase [Thermodesulfovibrio sp.]
MYLIYSILYFIALIFILPFEYLKRPAEIRKRWLRERFGFFNSSLITYHSSPIWIHAVSVGEVLASVPLIKRLKESHPSLEIVVSTVTNTGQKVARERIAEFARIVYVPFDMPFAVRNALRYIKPALFIIMETELWPNIIKIFSQHRIPVILMNGRISDKSFNGYMKLRFFIKNVLEDMSMFCMQNELYAERIRLLGANHEKVRVIGNFKFDTKPSFPVPEWTGILKGNVIVAGSTHRTEEDLILEAYSKLKTNFPQLNIIIAPRHPERFKEVEELVRKRGLEYIKRSEISLPITHHTSLIILLDVMGELSSVYGAADIAVMGGTFIGHGGQNPLEPAYWGKPVVCGPHMENFPFIDEFYRNGAAVKVDRDNLYQTLKELLGSKQKTASMGMAAKELYNKNAGATERAVDIIESFTI